MATELIYITFENERLVQAMLKLARIERIIIVFHIVLVMKQPELVLLLNMSKKCPDILTPMKATRWSPVGKNTIYTALKNGEIESYTYKGGYIFTKDAFIDYLVKTANDSGRRYTIRGDKKC